MNNKMETEVKPDEEPVINIGFYRKIVQKYIELNRFKTAQFWAEKVVTLSNENEKDLYWLAMSMYSSKEYHRAAHLIKSKNLHNSNPQCCYLAASCLSAAKNYDEAIQTLTDISFRLDVDSSTIINSETAETADTDNLKETTILGNSLLSCIYLERGRVYEALDNRELAVECFMEALRADIFCYEAFETLIQHQHLPAATEEKLLTLLPLYQCPTEADRDLVKYLYESKLNKYREINTFQSLAPAWLVARLSNSLDQKVADAERHYYNCNMHQCHRLTKEVMSRDPYHMGCLSVHISCLVEQKNSNDLFLLAHRLVEIYPENGISWYAVGCYYYVIGKSDSARRYLGKATALDKCFGPAWLAYGHSFAADTEHDQAMAAYFKAAQLMTGCHLPYLYIGLENGLANNEFLAKKFFLQAKEIAPNDPFVLHEIGVISFQSANYDTARKYFEQALDLLKVNEKTVLQMKWEPLLNNLAHVYRKLQLYEKAIAFHKQALVLMPNNYSTHAGIGFCEILTGQRRKATETFHKALSLKRDDTFSSSMLQYVLEQQIQDPKDSVEPENILHTIPSSPIEEVKDLIEETAMKLGQSSCSDLQSCSMRMSDTSSGSTFMSTDPSFVVDVTNTQQKKRL